MRMIHNVLSPIDQFSQIQNDLIRSFLGRMKWPSTHHQLRDIGWVQSYLVSFVAFEVIMPTSDQYVEIDVWHILLKKSEYFCIIL